MPEAVTLVLNTYAYKWLQAGEDHSVDRQEHGGGDHTATGRGEVETHQHRHQGGGILTGGRQGGALHQ